MSQGPQSPFPPPKRPESSRINLLTAVLMILVAAMLWRVWGDNNRRQQLFDEDAKSRTVEARGDLAADEKATIAIFENASPSVVHVTTSKQQTQIFSEEDAEVPQGSGTGFVWDEQGRIVTNYHVLLNATTARVGLGSKVYLADFVGGDPDHDIAVIKIDAPKEVLRPIAVGTSKNLKVGQKVFAIGNPFGLDKTLSTGVVSGLQREFNSLTNRPITGAIQIDAAINPGNSGGPLLDSAGLLIGINTAIAGKTGQSAGVGFAIPVDMVNRIVPQIIQFGKPQRFELGVELAQDRLVQQLIQNGDLKRRGVLVWLNSPEAPGIRQGLRGTEIDRSRREIKLGDLIIGINDTNIETENDVYRALEGLTSDSELRVKALRGNQEIELKIKPVAAK